MSQQEKVGGGRNPSELADKKYKIMIVDDSNVVRCEIKQILAGDKFEVIEAVDGVEGCKLVEQNQDTALIFLDINMPNMDGLTMAEMLDKQMTGKALPRIPIIMLTTENSKDMVLRAKNAGVIGWIIKPPRKPHVLSIIDSLVIKAS